MENLKSIIKKHGFVIAIIVFAIIKQLLVSNLPITPYPNQGYDDDMMVRMAQNIRAGNWLGEYSSNILVKGTMFPAFLAVINYFGLSYISTMNFIYTIACIYFIYTLKEIFKTKKSLFLIYIVLLFNPVSFAWWTLQRVYRNGITLTQALFIIGSLFAMYQRRKNGALKMIPHSIIAGISIASLWLTREDGIWILPFTIVVILLSCILTIIDYKKDRKNIIEKAERKKINKLLVGKIIVILLPLIILNVALHTNRAINYFYYGVYEYNELSDGYFGKVIHIIYSVKTDEDIQYVTATRNKINKLCEYSETLNSIKPELDASMDAWANNDRHPGDGQVEDGWFFWSLKEAAQNAGVYESAEKSNEFYEKIYNEIDSAIKDGKIETQFSMPSNLMSPWKKQYFTELPKTMLSMTWYVVNFEDVQTVNYAKDISNDSAEIRRFESMTNDLSVSTKEDPSIDNTSKYSKRYVSRLNLIGKIYKKTGLIIAILSFICYVIITIKLIIRKDKKKIIDAWLLLTGVACTYLVLVGGVSYNHITACFSRYYMYLSGAYPLIGIFTLGSICFLIENIKKESQMESENE